jgi:hypothetical protein
MSLVSASKLVGGIKEYGYRGFQQMPLVIGSTSMLFTIATGSIAHANIALGMGILMPIYTYLMQFVIGTIMNFFYPNSIFWKRLSSDSCNIIPEFSDSSTPHTEFMSKQTAGSVPSHWLMGMAFFIGYSISNAVDSLITPESPGANKINHEKRNHQAIIVITTCVIFAFLMLLGRFYLMPGCEGMHSGDGILGLFMALGLLIICIVLFLLPTIITAFVIGIIVMVYYGASFSNLQDKGVALRDRAISSVTSKSGGIAGAFLSLLSATGASGIGYAMYVISKKCGARSSDLFGILSQILPPSATGPMPVICTASS